MTIANNTAPKDLLESLVNINLAMNDKGVTKFTARMTKISEADVEAKRREKNIVHSVMFEIIPDVKPIVVETLHCAPVPKL